MAQSPTMHAHRHLFGLRPHAALTFPDGLQEVVVPRGVGRTLRAQAQERGPARAGLLFGRAQGRRLLLVAATPARPPVLPGAEPLNVDPAYLLGASEALGTLLGGRVDWCGLWLALPGSDWSREARLGRWARRAFVRGLIDDQRPLLSVGFEDAQFGAHAWIAGADEVAALPLTLHGA